MNNIEKAKIERAKEKKATIQVLTHLYEIEKNQEYLPLAYSGLISFCMKELDYSEDEASIRARVVQLMIDVPSVPQMFKDGRISLTVSAKARSALRKSGLGPEEKGQFVESLCGKTVHEAEKIIAARFPQNPKDSIKPVAENLNRIAFNASDAFLEKLRGVRSDMAYLNIDDLQGIFERLMDDYLSSTRVAKRPVSKRTNRIFVREKAGYQCQHIDKNTGRRCDGRTFLQIDHIFPRAHGGGDEIENLQVLCARHNRFKGDSVASG